MTTQLATSIEPKAPLRSKPVVWHMGFSGDTDFDTAAAKFEMRHGHPPRVLVRDAIVKAGPIGEQP